MKSRRPKISSPSSAAAKGQPRSGRPIQPTPTSQPSRHDHTEPVRRRFGIDAPKTCLYFYGDQSAFEAKMGEVRDGRAWGYIFEYAVTTTPSDPPPSEGPQLAVLCLRPGVSKREAKKAIDRIYASFPRKHQRRRPDALTPRDHQLLREIFELAESKAGRPLRPAVLIPFADAFCKLLHKGLDYRHLSRKTIEKECEMWRRETGRPIR